MSETSSNARAAYPLNESWDFVKGRVSKHWLTGSQNLSTEEKIQLPHCWNAQDTFQDGVNYYRGTSAYRKSFKLPVAQQDGTWILSTEGFYGTGDLWLNGEKIAPIDGQYLGFCEPLDAALLSDGTNLLALRLTNDCKKHVLPGNKMPDFILYGGLAGRVTLTHRPHLHIQEQTIQIACKNPLDNPNLEISYTVHNAGDVARSYIATWALLGADGQLLATSQSGPNILTSHEEKTETASIPAWDDVRLWSDQSPTLYTVRCTLAEENQMCDQLERTFGLRTATFTSDGFILNGKRVELHGCNRHESMPGFGNALPTALHQEDAHLLKNIGCNFVRLSHYPQHPTFLDACDRLGLLVYPEIATWKSVRTGRWLTNACRQLKTMILRDRHHPSVILWGLGNESRSRKAYIQLDALAKSLDPTRSTIYAENHLYRAKRQKTLGLTDVWGANYELSLLDEVQQHARKGAVVVSECSNYPHTKRGDEESEKTQLATIQKDLQIMRAKKFVAGFNLWCFNDYATLRKKRYKRFSGLVDAWRIPKMSAALMSASYLKEPYLRIFGDWSSFSDQTERTVHVFTNCDNIQVRIGQQEVVKSVTAPYTKVNLPFSPEVLSIEGQKDNTTARDQLTPFGAGKIIHLQTETLSEQDNHFYAIALRIQDEESHTDTTWTGEVDIHVEGPAYLHAYRPNQRMKIAGGLGRIFIQATASGPITVQANTATLAPGQLTIDRPLA